MSDFLAVAHTATLILSLASVFGLLALLAMWQDHPEAKLMAEHIDAALDHCGKHGPLASILFGDTKMSTAAPRLSRALTLREPLNIYRLALLGRDFWLPFATRIIRHYGGEVFSPEQVNLLRGAERIGANHAIRVKADA